MTGQEDDTEGFAFASAINESEHRQALARALLGMPLSIDEAERTRLHSLLDQVLDYRSEYESLPRGLNALRELMLNGPNPEEGRLAQATFSAATELFVRCLGNVRATLLPPLGADPASARNILRLWLLQLSSILRQPGGMFGAVPSITLEQLIEELEDLGFGDQGSIFCATARKPGQQRKRGKLARQRLRALVWERYLRSQGARPGEAQAKVSNAFGESWATIEKWKKRVIPLLSQWRVDYELRAAEAGQVPTYNMLTPIDDQIFADGRLFRETLQENKNQTS